MPDINDLEDLENKIKSIGNEDKIIKDKKSSKEDLEPQPPAEELQAEKSDNENLLDDILDDFGKGNVVQDEKADLPEETAGNKDLLDFLENPEEDITLTRANENQKSDITEDDLLGDLSNLDKENKTSDSDDLSSILNEEEPAGLPEESSDDMQALLNNIGEDIEEDQTADKKDLPEDIDMTSFGSGMEESVPSEDKSSIESENILDSLGKEESDLQELGDLDSLLGEEKEEKPPEKKEEAPVDNDLEDFIMPEDSGIGKDLLQEGIEDKQAVSEEEPSEDLNAGLTKKEEGIDGLEMLEDISSFEIKEQEQKPEAGENDLLDFEKLDSLKLPDIEEESSHVEEIPFEEKPKKSAKKPVELPDELSRDEIRKNEDIELKLSDNERKQIVLTLTGLPKEAEIKLSKAIISNRYSNSQLKPLIDALIDSESPNAIIKIYEKISGDTSLSKIEAVKHEGLKFEERQKSFGYLLEKNIIPIVSRIAVGLVFAVAILFFIWSFIKPTVEASGYYNLGYKNLENKNFNDVEEYFEKGFNIQPRFKEAVKFARGYRKYKRYNEAEKKYELATQMKPLDEGLGLEFADFYRETKDYERSERKYKYMLNINKKNIPALLGLANTYLDWSEIENDKLNNAKDAYFDVLDVDPKNKEATFGNLNINLKLNNQKEILKYYNFIEKNFHNNVDPETYSKLGEYFIDNGNLDEAKKVLESASRSVRRGQIFPQIQYQFSRYKKNLQVYSEEKQHLQNALSQFERMKKLEDPRYEDLKYQRLLAEVYNSLGENAERTAKPNTAAELYYNKAIQTDPDYGKSYFNLANFSLKYKPNGFTEAKMNYEEAEKRGFTSDRLDFNLGWLYFKNNEFENSYRRIIKILDKQPENTNLKFMIGTIFYKLGKYDLAESMLLETYNHFIDISANYQPLETNLKKETVIIMDMLKKVSNNLGAAYQKKYLETRKSKYLVSATKYYYMSMDYYEKTNNVKAIELDVYNERGTFQENEVTKLEKSIASINLRMILYPEAGVDDPIIYEDFPLEYTTYM